MTDLFIDHLEKWGDSIALIDSNATTISYSQLAAGADSFAQRLGPERKFVVLHANNSIESLMAFIGCLRGKHPVLLTSAKVTDSTKALIETFRPNLLATPGKKGVDLTRVDDRPCAFHPDLCVLLATSGSTGTAKLVKLSRRNIGSNAAAITEYLELSAADRAITSLAPHYSYGMSVLTSHLSVGASIVLTDTSVTSPEFWDLARRSGITNLAGVPYTFEIFDRQNADFSELPNLRFMTQAGGKLATALIEKFAARSERSGWKFFVMYGQTEASPRMAFVPPDKVKACPDCIGVAIPGGALKLIDESGNDVPGDNETGELAYTGPNVMMGYASSRDDLSAMDEIPWLKTGDLAQRSASGLYKIIGRKARFVKIFGLRIGLDDIEVLLQKHGLPVAVAGNDELIVVGVEAGGCTEINAEALALRTGLPSRQFRILFLETLPRLATGKTNYRGLLEMGARAGLENAPPNLGSWQARLTTFASYFWLELSVILGLKAAGWKGVEEIFKVLLSRRAVSADDTFVSLSGDSLDFVSMSLALEDYLGRVPEAWTKMRISELEQVRVHQLD